ncbi:hypothetical protein OHA18_34250 [Kribbella sp. NBC_00709]|uniref:hypothetical protein n=1 Tax=Kribbella sp. NBC_00709 TaxID=2975972 RepID=UPI002E2C7C98|nr:hypothetical protein [Kribbella sp. NBC_00709]
MRDSGSAIAHYGGLANSGTISGSVTMEGRPVARSAYREQVRRIAPVVLEGRESEFNELAAFCISDHAASYAWWRAPAWAGKSALMSWFALNPPPSVRVVPFFVTARWAGQSDRIAFTDVVIEQLAELLDEPMPWHLTEATRDQCFLDVLRRAAESCGEQNERLILLVDGLDEDRGVTAGAGAHSIAALLPFDPPANLRIIVAGRPNPPMPLDVPPNHPLRDPSIIRPLDPSPAARVVKMDMLGELAALLGGSSVEQDLLGLVVAGGGGLSARDLAELTGESVWQVRDHLDAVAGRTFSVRQQRWSGNDSYVLGHEELQATARERIGDVRVGDYRQRLHEWAADYRDREWPAETPEYLLRGYFRLLRALGDLDRIVEFALDSTRHDRLMEITGGDTAAFVEIETAQDLLLVPGAPDLFTIARLARHKDRLKERNAHIPVELPALWAHLAYSPRAEALARAVPDPGRRATALALLAKGLAKSGQTELAATLAEAATDDCGQVALSRDALATALRAACAAWFEIGDLARVEKLARANPDRDYQGAALGEVVAELVKHGELDQAEALADSIPAPDFRARAIAEVAVARAARNERMQATKLLDYAISISGTCKVPTDELWAISGVVESAQSIGASTEALSQRAQVIALAKPQKCDRIGLAAEVVLSCGDAAQAAVLLDEATALLAAMSSWNSSTYAIGVLCGAKLAIGDLTGAEGLARTARQPDERAHAISALIEAAARSKHDRQRLLTLLGDAESAATSVPEANNRDYALSAVADAAIALEEFERAEQLASSIRDAESRAEVLVRIAARVSADDAERAHALAIQAEMVARSTSSSHLLTWASEAIHALLMVDDIDSAEGLASAYAVQEGASSVLAQLALANAAVGRLQEAKMAAAAAVDSLDTVEDPHDRIWRVREVAEALSKCGEASRAAELVGEAESAARGMPNPADQVGAMMAVIRALVAIEMRDHAVEMTRECAAIASRFDDDDQRILFATADGFVAIGDYHQAERVAGSLNDPEERIIALCGIATAHAEAGDCHEAEGLVERAYQVMQTVPDGSDVSYGTTLIVEAMVEVAKQLADVGETLRAAAAIEGAESRANAVADGRERSRALAEVVEGFLAIGQVDRAERLLSSISDPDALALSLAACTQKVSPHRAPGMVALALCAGATDPPLHALGMIAPDTLRNVAKAVRSDLADTLDVG